MTNKFDILTLDPSKRIVLYILSLFAYFCVVMLLDYGGFFTFLYALLMPLVIIGVYLITWYFFKKWFFSALAALLMATIIIYDLIAPRIWFAEYCRENNVGLKIYDTVNNVRGYFDATEKMGCRATCQDGLLKYGYDYFETYFDSALFNENAKDVVKQASLSRAYRTAYPYSAFVTETGYYRFNIIQTENDPRCETFNHWLSLRYEDRYDRGLGRIERYKGLCIAAEKVKSPTSDYAYSYENRNISMRGEIRKFHRKVTKRTTGKVLAESIFLRYLPNNLFYAHQQMSNQTCPNKRINFDFRKILLMN